MAGASGALASLWVSFFELDAASGRAVPTAHGGTRVPQILAYEDGRFESWITVPHGQVTEIRAPGSPHLDQTIDDFVARRFRRVPIDRAEVLAELSPWGDDPTHEHRAITMLALP